MSKFMMYGRVLTYLDITIDETGIVNQATCSLFWENSEFAKGEQSNSSNTNLKLLICLSAQERLYATVVAESTSDAIFWISMVPNKHAHSPVPLAAFFLQPTHPFALSGSCTIDPILVQNWVTVGLLPLLWSWWYLGGSCSLGIWPRVKGWLFLAELALERSSSLAWGHIVDVP